MNSVIQIEGLSKRYVIRHAHRANYATLREEIAKKTGQLVKHLFAPGSVSAQKKASSKEEFWALNNISFEVNQGDKIGIIGRNGAGKTTLLKIISRITEPTSGRVKLKGRVASLLEVGTGFHPELTGRENIYLNGAILGMKKAEIRAKFDEIVSFAEIEKFLDTPVKRYSSGMYVRLAFAVAAHLEPEILLVDEVLAVGDAAFQKKCLGKMGDVSRAGRTILFVSHNMAIVENLCSLCILLDNGQIASYGPAQTVIAKYVTGGAAMQPEGIVELTALRRRHPAMKPTLKRMWLTNAAGMVTASAAMGEDVTFHIEYEHDQTLWQPVVGLTFFNQNGQRLFATSNRVTPAAIILNGVPHARFACRIRFLPLVEGEYSVSVGFARTIEPTFDGIDDAFRFHVESADIFATGWVPTLADGSMIVQAEWSYHESDTHQQPAQGRVAT
jgi:lipopolysaccharide transport system ATP-binding protein